MLVRWERQYFKEEKEDRFCIAEPKADDPILIVCPKCNGKASIVPFTEYEVRATCFSCGYSATKSTNTRSYYWYDENPTDGVFGFDLWLTTNCDGNSLWAFNIKHLNILEAYVSAELRERSKDEKWGWSNSSLTSRLPKWIKSAKNRESLLKAIHYLKSKA